jgi:hypothetical protein
MLTREKLQRGEGELAAENPLIGLRKRASHSENMASEEGISTYVAGYVGDTWTSQHSTLGSFFLVVDVPHGPVMGFLVAPCGWLVGCVKVYGLH